MSGSDGSDRCDSPERVAAWIAATVPECAAVAIDHIRPSAACDAAAQEAIARAVARRRDEFTTGRRLAHEALARLGCVAASLPPDRDRVPRWPESFVGTISHSGSLCAALVEWAAPRDRSSAARPNYVGEEDLPEAQSIARQLCQRIQPDDLGRFVLP
jgi:hypothetical protein